MRALRSTRSGSTNSSEKRDSKYSKNTARGNALMPARADVQDRRAEQGTKVWSYDFVIDQAEEDRRLCLMIVVDEYTTAVVIMVSMRRHILSRANVVASERQLEISQSPFALRFYSHSV